MTTELHCSQPGCIVSDNGKCLEGFTPVESCPHVKTNNKAPTSQTKDTSETPNVAITEIPSGEAITEDGADNIPRQFETKVVIIAGPPDSGKTTIITSLYEEFQGGPYSGFIFAGSNSLIGFERRCHEGRKASGNKKPDTVRTPSQSTVNFLHLRLAKVHSEGFHIQNLLLADMPGETFKAIRDSSDAVNSLRILQRADSITLLLDGALLIDRRSRHNAAADSRMILRSILQENVLANFCKIDIVFSKWDLIQDSAFNREIIDYIKSLKNEFTEIIGQKHPFEFHEIAARPTKPSIPFALGIPVLLRSWMESPAARNHAMIFLPQVKFSSREVMRFGSLLSGKSSAREVYEFR